MKNCERVKGKCKKGCKKCKKQCKKKKFKKKCEKTCCESSQVVVTHTRSTSVTANTNMKNVWFGALGRGYIGAGLGLGGW
eukprot:scaffold120233_cov45-Phaeocystis_antarctica.AAC.1